MPGQGWIFISKWKKKKKNVWYLFSVELKLSSVHTAFFYKQFSS